MSLSYTFTFIFRDEGHDDKDKEEKEPKPRMINHHGKVRTSFNSIQLVNKLSCLNVKEVHIHQRLSIFNRKSIAVKPFLMKTVSESHLIDDGSSQNGGGSVSSS